MIVLLLIFLWARPRSDLQKQQGFCFNGKVPLIVFFFLVFSFWWEILHPQNYVWLLLSRGEKKKKANQRKPDLKRVNIDVDIVSPSLPHQFSQTERNDLHSLLAERKKRLIANVFPQCEAYIHHEWKDSVCISVFAVRINMRAAQLGLKSLLICKADFCLLRSSSSKISSSSKSLYPIL